jgi:dTDP-glucose 4,6-dehydratase
LAVNIFITGGTGFWGKNILKRLINNELNSNVIDQIVVLSRNPKSFLKAYPEFQSHKIEYIEGDVRNFKSERTDFQYILHLATDASNELNHNNPLEMMDVIINGTKHALEFAKQQTNLKKFLFASSGAVYGAIPEVIQGVREDQQFELDFTNPINAYAQSKRTAEMMCHIYVKQVRMPIVIIRGFAFVGDYLPQDAHFAIGNFVKQAQENKKIVIKSDGSPKRSYLHSVDMAKYILEILFKEKNKFVVYNLGSDEGKTLKEWASIISKKYGNAEIEVLGEPNLGYSAGNNYIPNIDKLKNELNLEQILNPMDYNRNEHD